MMTDEPMASPRRINDAVDLNVLLTSADGEAWADNCSGWLGRHHHRRHPPTRQFFAVEDVIAIRNLDIDARPVRPLRGMRGYRLVSDTALITPSETLRATLNWRERRQDRVDRHLAD